MTEHKHAEAIRAYADGKKLEFRVAPNATAYGSTDEWYPCDNPDFHPRFEYRVRRDICTEDVCTEVEKLNIISAMHEGYD